MKKMFLGTFIAGTALLLTGCSDNDAPRGWYKTDGGYINLNRVNYIDCKGYIAADKTLLNGPLTVEKLLEARKAVQKMDDYILVTMNGSITFDKSNIMELPGGVGIKRDDALKNLDKWLDALEQLRAQLPESR